MKFSALFDLTSVLGPTKPQCNSRPDTRSPSTLIQPALHRVRPFRRRGRFTVWLPPREPEYRRAAASRLLDLYNRSWRDGEALDLDNFMRRLSVSSISIAPLELGATLYYADGGLFAGHFIEVFLDTDFSFSNVQLAG